MYRLELYGEILLRFALILWDLILDSSRFSQPEGTRKLSGTTVLYPARGVCQNLWALGDLEKDHLKKILLIKLLIFGARF